MVASSLVDLVKVQVLTTGTGAFLLGPAVPSYRGIEALVNGATYSYSIQQNDAFEIGKALYLASSTQLIRSVERSSNGNDPLDLKPNATVAFVALAEDILARDVLQPLYGNGAPLPGQGLIGQVYYNLNQPVTLFGPKTDDGWGDGVSLQGADGNNGATATNLAGLKAVGIITVTPPTNLNGVWYFWTAGDYTGQADDINIVKADGAPLTTGAWIRQSSASVQFQQAGAGAVKKDAQSAIQGIALLTNQFDTLQHSSDASDSNGTQLILPGAVISVTTPISIIDKFPLIRGVPHKTTLTSSGSPAFIINGESASEISYSPFTISGVDMNGASGVTTAAIGVRYRRNYVIENGLLSNAPIGLRLKDANSGVIRNIRTSGCPIGLHSVGSNFQTAHDSCSFNDATDVGIKIEANGTAGDGNYGLSFVGCLAQNNGRCIEIAYGCQADWYSGYMGESTTGYAIDNKGGIFEATGGVFFFDNAAGNFLVHPIGSGTATQGGVTKFTGSRIASSGSNGLAKLVNLATGEVDLTKNGKVVFQDVDIYALVAGGGLFNGDPIGCIGPRAGLVNRNGVSWSPATSGGSGFTNTASGNARTVTCTASAPPNIIGFSTPLLSTDYRLDGPMFFIMCYQSTKDLVVRTGTAPLTGGGKTLGTAPATGAISATGWKTLVLCEANPTALTSGVLEMFVNGTAVNGDACSLLRAGLADADFVNSGGKAGNLCNLYFP